MATLDYPNAKIEILADTQHEKALRVSACAKEPMTVEWIERIDPLKSVLWDVGANVGCYSLVAASRGIQVIAIEPHFASFHHLMLNMFANPSLASRIIALPVALGAGTMMAPFSIASKDAGSGDHVTGSAPPQAFARIPVQQYKTDDLIYQLKVACPTHMKIDVDGSENDVLLGARDTLAYSVQSVLVELRPGVTDAACHNTLAPLGFTLARDYPIRSVLYRVYEKPHKEPKHAR